jgi:hypothetical protein
LLALGYDKQYVANEVEVSRGTIYNWLDDPEFAAEVDRLSVMLDVSSRAERLRIAMRIVRQRTDEDGNLRSDKDLLDWLKFAQSETDGAKIDLSKLAELLAGESAQQGDGPVTRQLQGVIEVDATSGSNEQSRAQDVVVDEDALNPS